MAVSSPGPSYPTWSASSVVLCL